ncbi:MAG: polysaccharide pyruvyl transferase family protein [Deltaproteobacteria bacterium]|nr:polysaccharide pyruvyl transferase family protein [Deltaproteobacteria bacterium]
MSTVVELASVSFQNKGDELMAIAAKEFVNEVRPDWDVAVPIWLRGAVPEDLKTHYQLGFSWVLHAQSAKEGRLADAIGPIASLLPARLLPPRLVRECDVRAVLEITGFSYGDDWGRRRPKRMRKWFKAQRERRKKIVLLPKTFGPFKDSQIGTDVRRIVELADLVFARDEISFEHLRSIGAAHSHVKVAPDYTHRVTPRLTETALRLAGRACFVPNKRMVDKTDRAVSETYVFSFARAIREAKVKGTEPFLLIHQKRSDLKLAEEIRRVCGFDVEIVDVEDSREIKGVVSQAAFAVSSRLHGAINALGQGVPCVVVGWSHKYPGIAKDFDATELLVRDASKPDELIDRVGSLCDAGVRAVWGARLRAALPAIQARTAAMWSEIEGTLG